ncbi:MAG: thiamine phosphate synthase [Rhodospirillaceae bacterium]|nr:thiamine phosphate synthase [Rhodospirillaceae bacterium]
MVPPFLCVWFIITIMTCRLYLITPPQIEVDEFKPRLIDALDGGDVGAVQLRLKNSDGTPAPVDVVRRAATELMPIVQARDIAFIINDHALLAGEIGADGVHIGQSDISYNDARKAVGPDGIVGVTCHASTHLAMTAGEAGADYVAFGAFFPTNTKQTTASPEIEILESWAAATNVPAVAIGGITPENCAELAQAGADFVAVVNSVWGYRDGPGAAVKAFNSALKQH